MMNYIGNQLNFQIQDSWAHRFDYVEPFDPPASFSPPQLNMVWLNSASGVVFHCTDNSPSGSYWNGEVGA